MKIVILVLILFSFVYLFLQSLGTTLQTVDLKNVEQISVFSDVIVGTGGHSLARLIIASFIILSIFYWSFQDWRRSLKAVFFILVIDGALRKWVFPQFSEPLYFLKDFVLLGSYFRYYFFSQSERHYPIKINFTNTAVWVASGWCLFQSFNPYLGSPFVGMLGIKAYLFYIPMIWMLPNLFRSEEELYIFLRNHLILIIPVGILGIIQFGSPADSPINQYIPGTQEPVATFGFAGTTRVRITGTFSYLNSYQGYLSACFGLFIAMLSYPQTSRWVTITYIALFFNVINAFMTGSRTPIIAAIIFLFGFVVIRTLKDPERTFIWLSRLVPFVAVGGSAALIAFRPVIDAFSTRVTSNSDLGERVSLGFSGPFDFMALTQFDGYGTGSTHAGTGTLRYLLGLPMGAPIPIEVEPEMGKIALELGPIGFIFWYGMRVVIIIMLLRTFFHLKRPFLRDLALAGALIHTALFIGHMVFHHTFSVYYWFYTGFIFMLPWLEQIENWRSEQQLMQYYDSASYFPPPPDR
ncbi:hypothetical protein K4A83_17790 [Spirulina subsalsa FACHB-351]|uniref:Oligosaccharide repeat unit polymerase n=1 Tax=Spirulina subsalsa FACHB-351 TaxID=234711 RepID=A0ABT3LAG9_9CYAN|nr:hypothetical protein [Spirulina subsalsa FACHB-351]